MESREEEADMKEAAEQSESGEVGDACSIKLGSACGIKLGSTGATDPEETSDTTLAL